MMGDGMILKLGGGGAMAGGMYGTIAIGAGMITGSCRAGQPANATTSRIALAITAILTTSGRCFMVVAPLPKEGKQA
jgi:hypothetical protein